MIHTRKSHTKDMQSIKELYRFLYIRKYKLLLHELKGSQQESEEVFQDAFMVLIETFSNRETKDFDKNNFKYLEKKFERLLYRQLYSFERSVFWCIQGVMKGDQHAIEHLVGAVRDERVNNFLKSLGSYYKIKEADLGYLLNGSIEKLVKKARDGHLMVSASNTNQHNRNIVFKFFNAVLKNDVSDQINRNSREDTYAPQELPETAVVAHLEWSDSLPFSTMIKELLYDLDEIGRFILEQTYYHQRTPKQIAKISPYASCQTTSEVKSKKKTSIKKLNDFLSAKIRELEPAHQEELKKIYFHIMEKCAEPCKTILIHSLSDKTKSMEEIAEILQRTRPEEEIMNLKTKEQVKRRKYKCLQFIHNHIWEILLNK